MRLGEDVVGLRKLVPRLDGGGQPVRDEYGDRVVDAVDVEVPGSLITPTARVSARTAADVEPEDRSAPAVASYTWLAPAGTDIGMADVAVWPITARDTSTGQLQLTGRTWQVVGEPGLWEESVEVRLRAAT